MGAADDMAKKTSLVSTGSANADVVIVAADGSTAKVQGKRS